MDQEVLTRNRQVGPAEAAMTIIGIAESVVPEQAPEGVNNEDDDDQGTSSAAVRFKSIVGDGVERKGGEDSSILNAADESNIGNDSRVDDYDNSSEDEGSAEEQDEGARDESIEDSRMDDNTEEAGEQGEETSVKAAQRERRTPNIVFTVEIFSETPMPMPFLTPSSSSSSSVAEAVQAPQESSSSSSLISQDPQGPQMSSSVISQDPQGPLGSSSGITESRVMEASPSSSSLTDHQEPQTSSNTPSGHGLKWRIVPHIHSIDTIQLLPEDAAMSSFSETNFMSSLHDKFNDFVTVLASLDAAILLRCQWRMECFHRKNTPRTMEVHFIRGDTSARYRTKDHFVKEFKERLRTERRKERAAKRQSLGGESAASKTSSSSATAVKRKTSKRLKELKKKQMIAAMPKRVTRATTRPADIRPAKKPREPTITDRFADLIKTANRVVVVLGAGVSTAAGLPDFRTKTTGLYSAISSGKLGKDALPAELLFHAETFEQDPVPFYDFASKTFMPLLEAAKPTLAHHFVRLLMDNNKLLRCYTQNVDGLEKSAGVDDKYLVLCHGTLRSGRCMRCRGKVAEPFWWQAKSDTNKGIPECSRPGCKGDLRPEMIFFGEEVPALIECRLEHDVKKCDLLIVMGTSLSVRPVSGILEEIPKDVPRVWINRVVPPDEMEFTLTHQGDCDDAVGKLLRRLRWWG